MHVPLAPDGSLTLSMFYAVTYSCTTCLYGKLEVTSIPRPGPSEPLAARACRRRKRGGAAWVRGCVCWAPADRRERVAIAPPAPGPSARAHMTLDAELAEACSACGALPRAEELLKRGLEAGVALAPGACPDDAAAPAAPLTPNAAAPAPCPRRPSSACGGARSRGRRASRKSGGARRAPSPARCWHTLPVVDEEAALELLAGADVGAAGQPSDSRGAVECVRCGNALRRAAAAARAGRRARRMGDQEIQPDDGGGGQVCTLCHATPPFPLRAEAAAVRPAARTGSSRRLLRPIRPQPRAAPPRRACQAPCRQRGPPRRRRRVARRPRAAVAPRRRSWTWLRCAPGSPTRHASAPTQRRRSPTRRADAPTQRRRSRLRCCGAPAADALAASCHE